MQVMNSKWFVLGQFCLGLLIGFVVGLSISPVVGSVLGLIFAFAGGSINFLLKDRQEGELDMIGKGIAAISIAIILGCISGIVLRANDMLRFTDQVKPAVTLPSALTVEDLITLGKQKVDPQVFISIIKNNQALGHSLSLSTDNISTLHKVVDPYVLSYMFDQDATPAAQRFKLSQEDIISLTEKKVSPAVIQSMLKAEVTAKDTAVNSERTESGTVLHNTKESPSTVFDDFPFSR